MVRARLTDGYSFHIFMELKGHQGLTGASFIRMLIPLTEFCPLPYSPPKVLYPDSIPLDLGSTILRA